MVLAPFLNPELTLVLEPQPSRDALFAEISARIEALVPGMDRETIAAELTVREAQSPTSTPEGVAFPHVIAPDIQRTVLVVVKVKGGVAFGVDNHPPCDLVFFMFGSSEKPWEHVRLLARLARLVHTEEARRNLRSASDAAELHERLQQEDASYG